MQFVDAPSASANVRHDFNSQTSSVRTLPLGGDGLDLGNPSFTGEPGGVGAIYGYRPLRLTQRIIGSRVSALARMSALSRELLRENNWLRLQHDPTTTPVYFRTYRTEPGSMSMEWSNTADAWDLTVPLVADPFAYGPRQTISTATITQAPSGTNAMRLVLPAIKGDAPTPLRVTIAPASGKGDATGGCSWAIGCIAGTSSMADTVIDIGTGDGFTAGTGTGAAVTNANYFGGSYRSVTISVGEALIDRLTGTVPNLPAGRYKVLLRYEADGSTSVDRTYIFQWTTAANGTSSGVFGGASTSVRVPQNAAANVRGAWVDLGDFTYPTNVAVDAETPPGQAAPASASTVFHLKMATGGAIAGTVRIDAIKLIPVGGPTVTRASLLTADYPSAFWPWYRTSPSTLAITGTFDGDTESSWATAVAPSSPTGLMSGAPQLSGGFPYADPNAEQNLLIVMALDAGLPQQFGPGTATTLIDSLNATCAVDISYYPRWLYVGDGT